MKLVSVPSLLAAALFSLTVVIPFLPEVRRQSDRFAIEVQLTASASGHAQFYFDNGSGFREENSARMALPDTRPATYRFSLPPGDYQAFRFDPQDRDGTIVAEKMRVIARDGRVLRNLSPKDFKPSYQIESLSTSPDRLEVTMTPGAGDPQLLIKLDPVLAVHAGATDLALSLLPPATVIFALLAGGLVLLDRATRLRVRIAQAAVRNAARPGRAIAFLAVGAVLVSAYPVVFLGKSYVSPNMGTRLLYDEFPTLPGYHTRTTADSKGSDVGAVMWQQVPYSMVEHDALFHDGELPLFNRYNSGGIPLLGQGQSMFGDPLHFLVVVANGAAGAWDLKYLIAKWLFATGLGLLVFALVRHLPSALLVALAAPFAGFFIYRINHPAFFSVCYAPWALYCWLRFTQATGGRALAGWASGLILANWALLTSGTVKEAYMLLLTMNFSGVCLLAASAHSWREQMRRLGVMAAAGVVFILLSAPVWLTFLDSLQSSYTSYNAVSAFQIQPGLLLGAFDELFYRPLTTLNRVFNPSANFLILLGVLYFLATIRTQFADRPVITLAASSLLPLSFAFGLVPAAWIVQLPFFKNIAHLDNSFTCALIVLWSVIAGAGFRTAARRLGTPEGRADLAIASLLLFALVFAWIASLQALHRSVFGAGETVSFLASYNQVKISGFVWGSLALMLAASASLAVIARRSLIAQRLSAPAALLAALCVAVLLWRGALHAQNVGFEDYTARPPARVDFHAASPAIGFVQSAQNEGPWRAAGMQGNFFPGWTGAYALEGINGPDALMSPLYRELTGASPVERIWDWRLYLSRETLPAARPFLDFLNVRYYFDLRSDQAALGAVLKLDRAGDLDVYESPTAWPRAFFTDRLSVYDRTADLVQLIARGDGRPFASIQAQDAGSSPRIPANLAGRTVTPARHFKLTANTTSFDVHATGPGVVALTEVWWPDSFHAELNGRSVPVLRINHAFKGVAISAAGDYTITFSYRPPHLTLALWLAAGGLALLIAGIFWTRHVERKFAGGQNLVQP